MRRIAILALVLLAPAASAHVESLPGQGASLARAVWLGEPPAIEHDEISQHGGIRYYAIDLEANETIHIRLARSPEGFTTGIPPSIAILGPGVPARGFAPAFLERPENATAMVMQGVYTEALDYDPIAAVASSTLAVIDFTPAQSARYVLAVYHENQGGSFSLEVGEFAPFGFYRMFGIPRGATELRSWEGQSWAHTSLPTVLGVVGGAALAFRVTRRYKARGLSGLAWFSVGAGVLILASGASYAHQALHHADLGIDAVTPTILVSVGHFGLAGALAWNGLREPPIPRRAARLRAAMLGLLGIMLWAGFFWGPSLAILASFLPEERTPSSPV